MKFDFTTNTILQVAVLGIVLYYSWGEKIQIVLPIFIGTTYVAFTFTKNVMNSLIMASVLSYTLLIILFKQTFKKSLDKR